MIYAKMSFPFNILRTNGQNFTKFYICTQFDKIYVGIVTHHFLHIFTRVMALDLLQKLVSAQYLENKWTDILRTNGQILTKLYIAIYTDKIYVGIVSCHFSQICNRVMTLD